MKDQLTNNSTPAALLPLRDLNSRGRAAETLHCKKNREAARGAIRLEERDLKLMTDLFAHGALLRGQAQRLHFSSLRRCNRRLKQLYDAGYIARAPLPLGPQATLAPTEDGGWGGQLVYRLGSAGAPFVALRLGWSLGEVRRLLKPGTPLYLAHTLEAAEFRLGMMADAAKAGVEIVRFLPERLLVHKYEVREEGQERALWRPEVFRPDGFFQLAAGSSQSFFFVEVDLGHTSAREFAMKLQIHLRYRATGLFAQRYSGRDFRTLVVTTGPTRREHLRAIAEDHSTDLFWTATLADIGRYGPLAPIWHVPRGTVPIALIGVKNDL